MPSGLHANGYLFVHCQNELEIFIKLFKKNIFITIEAFRPDFARRKV